MSSLRAVDDFDGAFAMLVELALGDWGYSESKSRAWATDATEPPRSSMILADFCTNAALDEARTPLSR